MLTFFSVATLEYVKIAGYVVSGYAAARVWFAKEITYGKKLIAFVETKAKTAEEVIKADIKKVESAVVNEAKKL